MVFIFDSDLLERDERQDWLARLMVKCGDVPRLMREGFHWDSGNLVHEDGYIMYRRLDEDNSGNTRFYFLKDRQYPPRWTASLEVHASCVETLYRFDLDQLSREIIFFAAATSQAGDSIYQYYHHSPAYSFNAIYDDMPMEGKWPLPRNYSEDQV
ncbi:hypothetical protein GGS21DRAFT_505438 [Xylaria nigripes]|nr:hypothetical protein GGS21DRAFT_505438 [Xylaria nigripes]